jgi:hypothetical protein
MQDMQFYVYLDVCRCFPWTSKEDNDPFLTIQLAYSRLFTLHGRLSPEVLRHSPLPSDLGQALPPGEGQRFCQGNDAHAAAAAAADAACDTDAPVELLPLAVALFAFFCVVVADEALDLCDCSELWPELEGGVRRCV